ncbi:hypothetical protein, partial [Rhizocola hellebori]|uniref:hypothetical protein n=1 Tax=Rhizocola hellebori TaxID=1392758 RepID=UPI00194285BA
MTAKRLIATLIAAAALTVGAAAVAPSAALAGPVGTQATTVSLRSAMNNKCLEILGLNNSNGA